MHRVLLDAHKAGGVIGSALRSDGHGVLAIAEEAALDLTDPEVLQLAIGGRRLFAARSDAAEWHDLALFLSSAGA